MEESITKLKILYPSLFFIFEVDDNLVFTKEPQEGNIEYKRSLNECCNIKVEKYATQMRWRITESSKQIAIYYIGLEDNGNIIGLTEEDILNTIEKFLIITKIISASIIKIKFIQIKTKIVMQISVKIKKKIDNFFEVEELVI